MPRDLVDTITEIFNFNSYNTRTNGVKRYYGAPPPEETKRVYMDIPIDKELFEVPTFAFNTFINVLKDRRFEDNAIVAVLKTLNKTPRYVTLSRYMKDILLEDFISDRLVKLQEKKSTNEFVTYYATHGAIFREDFSPIMMCSWQIKRFKDNNGNYKYDFLRPIMRIDPACYVSKSDPIERFIANKLPVEAFSSIIYNPYRVSLPECFTQIDKSQLSVSLKVEIDRCPFVLKHADVPSISTTNESLLQVVIDHINEFIQ